MAYPGIHSVNGGELLGSRLPLVLPVLHKILTSLLWYRIALIHVIIILMYFSMVSSSLSSALSDLRLNSLLAEVPFSEEFKLHTSALASGPTTYGLIEKSQWGIPAWIDLEKAAKKIAEMSLLKSNLRPQLSGLSPPLLTSFFC